MPKQSMKTEIAELERALRKQDAMHAISIEELNRQLTHVGECLERTTVLVQTQDGEIGRLTALNDRMFKIIDKLITREET